MNNKNTLCNSSNDSDKFFLSLTKTTNFDEVNTGQTDCEICQFHEAVSYTLNLRNICSKCQEWFEPNEKLVL